MTKSGQQWLMWGDCHLGRVLQCSVQGAEEKTWL